MTSAQQAKGIVVLGTTGLPSAFLQNLRKLGYRIVAKAATGAEAMEEVTRWGAVCVMVTVDFERDADRVLDARTLKSMGSFPVVIAGKESVIRNVVARFPQAAIPAVGYTTPMADLETVLNTITRRRSRRRAGSSDKDENLFTGIAGRPAGLTENDEFRRMDAELDTLSQAGSWDLSPQTRQLQWSDTTSRIFGRDPLTFNPDADTWLDAVPEEEREFVRSVMADCAETGKPFVLHHRIQLPDGRIRMVRVKGEPVTPKDSQSTLLTGTVQDITEWSDRLGRNGEAGRILQVVLDTSADGIAFIRDGRITGCNGRLAELLGVSQDDIEGKALFDFSPAFQPDGIRSSVRAEEYREVLRVHGSLQVSWQFLRRDGEYRDADVTIRSQEAEKRSRFIAVVHDVTEVQQAAGQLRKERELVASIMETAPVGIAIVDREGLLTFANRFAAERLTIDRMALRDRPLPMSSWKMNDSNGKAVNSESIPAQQVLKTGKPVSGRTFSVDANGRGKLILSVNAAPLVDQNGDLDGVITVIEDLTKSHAAESALRDSEERFRFIAEHSSDMISRHAPDGTFRDATPSCRTLMGLEPGELFGTGLYDYIYPGDVEAVRDQHGKLFEQQQPQVLTYRLRRADGEYVWVESLMTAVRDPKTDAVYEIHSTTRDISDRRRMEDAARESEQRLRSVIDVAPFGAHHYELRPDGRLLFISGNQSAADLFRCGHDDLAGRTLEEAFPELATGNNPGQFRRIASGGGRYDADQVHVAGERFTGTLEIHAVQTGENRIALFFRDITERRRVEQSLQRSELWYRQIFENSPIAMFSVDQYGTILSWNPACTAALQYKPDELIGQPMSMLLRNEKSAENFASMIARIFREGVPSEQGFEYLHKSGETRTFLVRGYPLIDDRGAVVACNVANSDLTEQIQSELLQKVIYELTDAVHTSADLPELLKTIHRILSKLMDVSNFYVALREPGDDDVYSFPYAVSDHEVFLPVENLRGGLTALVARKGIPLFVDEKLHDRFAAAGEIELLGVPSKLWLGVPLKSEGGVIGVLVLQSYEDAAKYTHKHLDLLCFVSGQIAQAIERRRAADELKASEEKFRSIVTAALDIIAILSPEADIRYISPRFSEMFGYEPDSVEGTSCLSYIHPEDVAFVKAELKGIITGTNDGVPTEFRLRHRSGHWINVDAVGTNLVGDRQVGGILVVVRNNTLRKKAESALRESEAKYRLLAENSTDVIWAIDIHGNVVYLSPSVNRLLGFHPEELVGKPVSDFLPPEGVELVSHQLQRVSAALAEGQTISPESFQVPQCRKDGTIVWTEVNASLVFDDDGVFRYIAGSSRDIMARKKAEEALLESETRWRTLTENAPGLIHLIDRDGRILYINHVTPGYRKEDVIHSSIYDYVKPEHLESYKRYIDEVFTTGHTVSFEIPAAGPHGTDAYYTCTVGPLFTDGIVTSAIMDSVNITEQKKIEQQMAEWQQRYEMIISASGQLVYDSDLETGAVIWGGNIEKVIGYQKEEFCGGFHQWESHLHPADHDHVLSSRDESLRDHTSFDVEYRFRRKDGKYIWIHERGYFATKSEEKGFRMLGMMEDISLRKQVESDLYQSQQMLRLILDTIPERVFWKNRDLTYAGCNKQFAADASYDNPEDVMGKNDFELGWKAVAPLYRLDDEWVMNTNSPKYGYEEPQERPDGTVRWIRTSKVPLHDGTGNVIGVLGSYQDVTDWKHAEEQLRKLSRAIEQSPSIIVITDAAGVIEYVNPKFSQVTGYARDEAAGQSLALLKSEDVSDADFRKMWQAVKSGREWHGEYHSRKKDGTLFWTATSISPVTDASGVISHYIAIQEDITDRKQLEQQLYQAQKLETIGTLVSGISHDFNNILNNIVGFSGQLKKYAHDRAKVIRYSETMEKSALRGTDLAMQLLSLARKSKAEKQVIDVLALVDDIVHLCTETFPKNLTIEKNLPLTLPPISGQRGELYQALLNISLNARDAMPEGGRLTFAARVCPVNDELPAHLYTFTNLNIRSYLEITIADTGMGIPENIKARIFDPFFTTKERGQGTGLGLAMVYTIIRNHQGIIQVDSVPGSGSTFTICLPVSDLGPLPERTADTAPEISTQDALILLVDDEQSMRELGTELLQEVGYRVLAAKNGVEAVDIYRKHHREIDLVVLDLLMPLMDGGQAYIEMKKINAGVRAFFCTGYASDETITSLLKEGNLQALQKPIRPHDFIRMVKQVLHDG
jgi:two-component system, cell cycle sensor histidine kinase and response regulator CckA